MRYIGKCQYGRKNSWKTYLGSGVYLKRAINKYGKESFYKIIIDEAENDEELREIEEYYILMFDAVNNKDFYNIKYTSIGGDTFTNNPNKEHTRKLKSINSTGSKNGMYGRPKSKKIIDSIKLANSKPIQIDNIYYSSRTEASEKLKIPISTICYRLNSINYTNYKEFI